MDMNYDGKMFKWGILKSENVHSFKSEFQRRMKLEWIYFALFTLFGVTSGILEWTQGSVEDL